MVKDEPRGTHGVRLGASFTPGRPDPEQRPSYHGLRYNFRPATIDSTLPSTLVGGHGDGSGEYVLSTPSREPGGAAHLFKGTQTAQKDVDCLLIYDEESGAYRLERLASLIRLDHQRQAANTGATLSNGGGGGEHRTGLEVVDEPSSVRGRERVDRLGQRQDMEEEAEEEEEEEDADVLYEPLGSTASNASTSPEKRGRPTATVTRPHQDVPTMTLPPRSSLVAQQDIKVQGTRAGKVEDDDEGEEEEEDEDEDLDDLANMLESTLDESSHGGTHGSKPVPPPRLPAYTPQEDDELDDDSDSDG